MQEISKFYQRKKTINGTEYTAQFNGLSAALEMVDKCYVSDRSSNMSISKIAQYIFDNVIVSPAGLTPDSFDDMEEMNEVVQWAQEVAQGKFRDKGNEAKS